MSVAVFDQAGRVSVAAGLRALVCGTRPYFTKDRCDAQERGGSRVKTQWGDVAVVDVKTSAEWAGVAKIVADGAGVPGIENAFGASLGYELCPKGFGELTSWLALMRVAPFGRWASTPRFGCRDR